jgi:hypothetical protein
MVFWFSLNLLLMRESELGGDGDSIRERVAVVMLASRATAS